VSASGVLAGQVAVVTGGARGIGRASADLLSGAGAAVLIVDRLGEVAEGAARSIRLAGGQAVAVVLDLSDPGNAPAVVDAATRAFGPVDILVNNAGVISEVTTPELTPEQWGRVMAINLTAVVFVTQAVLPGMVRRGRGSIVNISSSAARTGSVVTGVDYATSKAGIIGITRTLARQYGPVGIRVNAVAPGPIATDMTRHWTDEVRQNFVARIPLGRLGTADDVARVVRFLAGPDSAYVTGATIDVNGGSYMG
jgi:NAD(P)-dependent dehydrogenase (short-subunit alcohol dehydrogenase family)